MLPSNFEDSSLICNNTIYSSDKSQLHGQVLRISTKTKSSLRKIMQNLSVKTFLTKTIITQESSKLTTLKDILTIICSKRNKTSPGSDGILKIFLAKAQFIFLTSNLFKAIKADKSKRFRNQIKEYIKIV